MNLSFFAVSSSKKITFYVSGSRPGSTDGDGYQHHQSGHVATHVPGHLDSGNAGLPQHGHGVGPKIRALQHQLKLTDINEASKGSLV